MSRDLIIGGQEYQISRNLLRVLALRQEYLEDVSDPEAIIQEIRSRRLPADLFTFWQRPPDTTPRFPYHLEWDNLAILEISSYENWLKRQIHPNARNKIRRAERMGLVVRVEPFSDKLLAGMVDLFNETPIRRGMRYSYYGWDMERARRTWATQLEQSHWIVAYYGEEFVGFIKLIICDRLARTSGTLAKEAHRDKSPMNAIFSKCVEVCASQGVPRLVYGKYSYGQKGEDSLTAFKKNLGFQKVDLPRYYVPLTTLGRIGLRLGLHHPLHEMVPAPVLQVLLNLRSKWYGLRK